MTPDSRWNRLPFLILIIIIISSTRKADPYGTPRSGPAEYGDFLDSLLFRLRDMEVLNESGPLKGTPQFTGSHVLIASMGGGEIDVEQQGNSIGTEYRLFLSAGETFEVDAGRKGMKIFLFRLMSRETGKKSSLTIHGDLALAALQVRPLRIRELDGSGLLGGG